MNDTERARIYRHAAHHIDIYGMDRTPTLDGSPSLGRIICNAHKPAGVPHHTEECRQLQTALAHAGNADTLAELVANNHTRWIAALLHGLGARTK